MNDNDNNVVIPNGCFTIQNTSKNTHRTVRIKTVKKGNLEGKRIISILTGPDNNSDYRGFGFVNDNGLIFIWNKHRDSHILLWIARYISGKFRFDQDVKNVNLLVEKSCIRCNRRLTTPESIKNGIGPECMKKV